MSLLRYRPMSSLLDLHNEIENMFNRGALSDTEDASNAGWTPRVDIKEDDKQYEILADIPGVEPEKVEVTFENGVLTLKGKKETESKEENEGYTRIERSCGSFYRRFTLPDTANSDKITATHKHGVLNIVIPKHSQPQSKRIDVKSH